MQLSEAGLRKIIQREGVILHAYQDSVGVWTIGTGHTSAAGSPKVTPGMVITQEQNEEILRKDLQPIQTQAAEYITVPVTQNQYDAIISIVFNVGPKFWHSTCIQRLNAGDVQGASNAIMQWCIPKEIIGRRKGEQQQFLTPDVASDSGSMASSGTLETLNNDVPMVLSVWQQIKGLFTSEHKVAHTSATGTIAAGGAAATQAPHNLWPWILGGTAIAAVLVWVGLYILHKKGKI